MLGFFRLIAKALKSNVKRFLRSMCTLEYRINVQQSLFKCLVLAHLLTYLFRTVEKHVLTTWVEFVFTIYLLSTRLFGLHVYLVLCVDA